MRKSLPIFNENGYETNHGFGVNWILNRLTWTGSNFPSNKDCLPLETYTQNRWERELLKIEQ